VRCDWETNVWGAMSVRRTHDVGAMSAQWSRDASQERRENIARTSRGTRSYILRCENAFCRENAVFSRAANANNKKKTLWIFTHMIYEEFFAGFFFFADLVEWRKDVVYAFSHIIRLIYCTSIVWVYCACILCWYSVGVLCVCIRGIVSV
jgi:hypothetical protein